MTLMLQRATRPDHEAIAQELAALEANGRLVPEEIVRAAESPMSPLHLCFTWDDALAGHAWRIEQARDLIRTVRVQVTTETRTISTVRYVHDPSLAPGEQGYVSVEGLRDDPVNAAAALLYELARADAYLSRAEGIAVVLGLRTDVVKQRGRLGRLRQRVEQMG